MSTIKIPKETTLQEACTATHRWQDFASQISSIDRTLDVPFLFKIPVHDFIEIWNEQINAECEYAHGYIGLVDNPEEPGRKMLKLFFVGMGLDKKDMVPENYPNGKVYDLTHPCPPTCDDENQLSPLMPPASPK